MLEMTARRRKECKAAARQTGANDHTTVRPQPLQDHCLKPPIWGQIFGRALACVIAPCSAKPRASPSFLLS